MRMQFLLYQIGLEACYDVNYRVEKFTCDFSNHGKRKNQFFARSCIEKWSKRVEFGVGKI